MFKCKICKVPLTGFLSSIPKFLFRVRPSEQNPQICNKCASKNVATHQATTADIVKGRKYKCQICQRLIHEGRALEHVKAEEYLMNLIKKDHPQWRDKEPTCPECVEYYRKLVKDAEI